MESHQTRNLETQLILPGNPIHSQTLSCLPPGWRTQALNSGDQFGFVVNPNTGLLEYADKSKIKDYLYEGDYHERLKQMGEDEGEYEIDHEDEFNIWIVER